MRARQAGSQSHGKSRRVMTQFPEREVVIFHGDVNPQVAHVYVQLLSTPTSDWQLRGCVRGPRSRLTRTLPATVRLEDLGSGPSTLARALVPDPCDWAPGQPYLYDVEVELCRGSEPVHSFSQELGVRSFGIDGSRLVLQGQPWTVAGCYDTSVTAAPWHAWREFGVAQVVVNPPERVCEEASNEGVVLIADLSDATPETLAHEVHRVGKWAAVMLILVRPAGTDVPRLRAAPNVVFAQYVTEADPLAPLGGEIPWIARRRIRSPVPLAEAVAQTSQACNENVRRATSVSDALFEERRAMQRHSTNFRPIWTVTHVRCGIRRLVSRASVACWRPACWLSGAVRWGPCWPTRWHGRVSGRCESSIATFSS